MLEAQARYIVRALTLHAAPTQGLCRRAARGYGEFLAKIDQWMQRYRVDHPVQQLLSCRQWARGHAVAAQRPRLLGDDAAVQVRRLHLRTGGPTGGARRAPAMTELDGLDGWQRLDPALRAVATTRTEFLAAAVKLMREPFNDRRREAAALVDDPVCRSPSARRRLGGERAGACLPRRPDGADAGGGVLPRRRIRVGKPRHGSPPVCGTGPPRPVHGGVGRLPAVAGTPVSGRVRRCDGRAAMGRRQRHRTRRRRGADRPLRAAAPARRWPPAWRTERPAARRRRWPSSCCTSRCWTIGEPRPRGSFAPARRSTARRRS